MAHDIFISYSKQDKPTADAICAALEANGMRCWIAPRDILPGSDWGEAIIDAIHGCRIMVLVFSGHSNASSQIKREIERAVNAGIPVVPFRIEDVMPSKTLEYFISTQHWLDALTPPLEQHLQYLATTMRGMLTQKADGSEVEVREPELKPHPAATPAPTTGEPGRKFVWPVVISLLVLAVAVSTLAVVLWQRQDHPAVPPVAVQSPEKPVIADKAPTPIPVRNVAGIWEGGLVNGARTIYQVTQTGNKIAWQGNGKFDGHDWEHTATGTIRGDEISAYFVDTAASYYRSKGSAIGRISEDGNSIYWSGFNPYEVRWTRKRR